MKGYFYLRDEFVELRFLLGDLTDKCAVDLVLEVGLPILIAIVGLRVKLGHLQLLRGRGGTSSSVSSSYGVLSEG